MSDPLIQTFCCHPTNHTPILSHFNSNLYNSICLLSSIAGITGAVYQILPRHETWLSLQWFSLTSLRGRQIIIWLALADLLASLGVFLRSFLKLNGNSAYEESEATATVVYCTVLAVWTQYFYSVTWCWTLCYAVDTWLAVQRRQGYPCVYHCIAWFLPATVQAAVFLSSSGGCERRESSHLAGYSLVAAVMVSCPLLYWLAVRHLHLLAASCLGQFTNKERSVVRTVCLRFGFIVLVFYICWLPNLVHGIVLAVSPGDSSQLLLIAVWYLMAFLNPLQALFNSVVYRRPHLKLVIPFKATHSELSETSPLIQANINA